MKTVKVKKQELITILTKNRAEHHDIFLEAQKNYRTAAIEVIDKQLELAKNNKPFVLTEITELVQPADYTKEYDRVLQMLEMSVDDIIEITAQEFQNFVQDIWNWSQNWSISNSGYSNSPKLALSNFQ